MWDRLVHRWLRVPYTLHTDITKKSKSHHSTVMFIHGIGESGSAWQHVIAKLPDDIKVISIDLLGFGKSPKPYWLKYNAKMQARSVVMTLLKIGPQRRLTIVGHSLGALVAVEIAKRYPLIVDNLILCSPPFYRYEKKYKFVPTRDIQLKKLYRLIEKRPNELIKISNAATKLGLVSKAVNVQEDNVHTFMGALEASIINQTSLKDAVKLNKPITILHGALDPVVIKDNLKYLVDNNPHADLKVIAASHEVVGLYVPAVILAIKNAINTNTQSVKRSKNRL